MRKDSKILIVGCSGLIGLGLAQYLKKKGFVNSIFTNLSQVDLTDQKSACSFFRKESPDYCILAPIKEGGIGANIAYPAELIYKNLLIQANVIHAAWKEKVKKLLFFASSCVYPRNCTQPLKEKYLLTGPLEETNEPYAVAKITGIKMCQAYNKQYNTKFVSVIPATVYGPNDSFDLKNCHVISALIYKFHTAKISNKSKVYVWGTGKPKREFIYADDLMEASLFLLEHRNSLEVVNVGVGVDLSILRLAEIIKRITGFKGCIEFDKSKPDGTPRKLLDTALLNSLGWKPSVKIESGLENTYCWYRENFLKLGSQCFLKKCAAVK